MISENFGAHAPISPAWQWASEELSVAVPVRPVCGSQDPKIEMCLTRTVTMRREEGTVDGGRREGMVSWHVLSVWYVPNSSPRPSSLLLIGLSPASQHPVPARLDWLLDFLMDRFWLPTYRNTRTGLWGRCYFVFPVALCQDKAQRTYSRDFVSPWGQGGGHTAVAEMEFRLWPYGVHLCSLPGGQWHLKELLFPFKNLLMVVEISGASRKHFWREDFFNIVAFHYLCPVWRGSENSCSLWSFEVLILPRDHEASSVTSRPTGGCWPTSLVNS